MFTDMALRKKKALAVKMRKEGASYSQIRDELGVSKSSLSLWLRDLSLPEERIRELRYHSPQRIERYRNTMQKKRDLRLASVREDAAKLIVCVHLYIDMDIKSELAYWSKTLGIPLSQFRKPYIKDSTQSGLSYSQRFTYGTCNVIVENRDIAERVKMSLDCVRSKFAE